MLKKMAVAAIIVGLVCLVGGVSAKLIIVQGNIAGFSPVGFGQGAVIFLLLSINLLLLDKNS
jgi:hypothetical protein